MSGTRTVAVGRALDRAERLRGQARRDALAHLADQLDRDAQGARDGQRVRALAGVVRELAAGRGSRSSD